MKNICKKTVVIGIILLFIGVSVSSAISVDNKPRISPDESESINNISETDIQLTEFRIVWLVIYIDDVTKEWNETLQEYVYYGTTAGGFIIFWIIPSIIFFPVILPANYGEPINVSDNCFYNPDAIHSRTRILPAFSGGITLSHFEFGFYRDEEKHIIKDLYEIHI
jgi:hypothetical protein